MQEEEQKLKDFKHAIGQVFKEIRDKNISLSKFAYEYDIDKSHLSKLERGISDCKLFTAWKIAEANGIKFSEFAKLLEQKLGDEFKLIEE